ncbi:MAG: hypothetical protein U0559_18455 [Anaerolineae bacterium]
MDDLKRIKGIGPATERRLRRAGVDTFIELAEQLPASLAKLFPQRAVTTLTDWVSEASRLAALHDKRLSPATITELQPPRAGRSNKRGGRDALAKKSVQSKKVKKRKTRRTTIAIAPLALETSEETHRPSPAVEPATAQAPAWHLKLCNVQLVMSADIDAACVLRVRRLQAQLKFELSGATDRVVAAAHQRLLTQVLAWDLLTGVMTSLGAQQQLITQDGCNGTTVVEFPTPPCGRYQLIGLICLPEQNAIDFALGDVLNVIPHLTSSSRAESVYKPLTSI